MISCTTHLLCEDPGASRLLRGLYSRLWGISLINGGSVRLTRLVGEGRALGIILTCRHADSEECYLIGLCELGALRRKWINSKS